MTRKAILAIAIANNLLALGAPGLAKDIQQAKSNREPDSLLKKIEDDPDSTATLRVVSSLVAAYRYLQNDYIDASEVVNDQGLCRWDKTYAKTLMVAFLTHETAPSGRGSIAYLRTTPLGEPKTQFVKQAIENALKFSPLIPDVITRSYAVLNASILAKRIGDGPALNKCQNILDDTVKSCEDAKGKDAELIDVALSILGWESNELIPVSIPDFKQDHEPPRTPHFSEASLGRCKLLKVRGLALVDRLDRTSQTRRKAHRDASIWYSRLGQADDANREKEILFDLIGFKDDSALYAKPGSCSIPVWWNSNEKIGFLCGQG